jgi:hypothetical protein
VVRQYASSHLDSDASGRHETRDHHDNYYLNFAFEHERKPKSSAQQAAMRDMTVELDNLRAAWDWSIQRGRFELIGKAVRPFGWYFEIAGLLRMASSHWNCLFRRRAASHAKVRRF